MKRGDLPDEMGYPVQIEPIAPGGQYVCAELGNDPLVA
jgi:hypothetical protein